MSYEEFLKQTEELNEEIERLTDEVEEHIFEAGIYYMEYHKNLSQEHSQQIVDYMSKAQSKTLEKISLLNKQLTLLDLVEDKWGVTFALKDELSKLIDQHYDMLLTMDWTEKSRGEK
jgi:hypothetical protein